MKKYVFALIVLLLSGCTNSPPIVPIAPEILPTESQELKPPCQTEAEHLRILTAYKINASLGARFGTYKLSRSSNAYIAEGAEVALKDRFVGPALDKISRQVANWPMRVEVQFPSIEIQMVTMNSSCSAAVLQTIESWSVISSDSQSLIIFQESNKPHTVTLTKTGGIITGKWVVQDISDFEPQGVA